MLSPPSPSTSLAREYKILYYNTCIPATCYILSKGPGRDKLVMSCTYSFFLLSGKLEMISIDVIGISTLYLYILEENSSIPDGERIGSVVECLTRDRRAAG